MTLIGAAATLLVLGSTVSLSGCAARTIERVPAPSRPPRAASLDEVLSAYEGYCEGLETLSASGDLDVRDLRAGKQRKLGIRVLATRGGRLYLKGSLLLLTALEVVSSGERFWFQVPSRKTVWTGVSDAAPEAEGADQAPYYALRPKDITAALLPEPLAVSEADAVSLEADRELFCLTLSRLDARGRGPARRRVCLDREELKPARSTSYDAGGELQSETTFGGYRDGAPRRVRVARPTEGYVADFAFDKVQINQPVPERAFSPRTPEDYKVVEVGAR